MVVESTELRWPTKPHSQEWLCYWARALPTSFGVAR